MAVDGMVRKRHGFARLPKKKQNKTNKEATKTRRRQAAQVKKRSGPRVHSEVGGANSGSRANQNFLQTPTSGTSTSGERVCIYTLRNENCQNNTGTAYIYMLALRPWNIHGCTYSSQPPRLGANENSESLQPRGVKTPITFNNTHLVNIRMFGFERPTSTAVV